MELKISSDPRWLRMVRGIMQEISRQAGFSEGETSDVALAVDEALCNVIKHSYKGDPNGPVFIRCEAGEGRLEIVVQDQGEGFDPYRVELRAPDEMRAGGRGIFLMRSTMDEVEFERSGDTNRVRLCKNAKARAR